MNNKQLILIVAAIIAAGCIIAGAIVYSNNNHEETNTTVLNNTTNNTDNIEEDEPEESKDSQNKESEYVTDSSGTVYNKNTGEIVYGQAEGLNYYEVQKTYDSSSPTACPHGASHPKYCPACS